MTRATEDEKEALRKAAEAAGPILARLRQQRVDLDGRIGRLEAIVAAYDDAVGRRRRVATGGAAGEQSVRMRHGQVKGHVDAVLETGADYTEPELRIAVYNKFGISYRRSTVYAVLRRGVTAGRYELQDGKRWRMKP